jgi:uncharacterized Ntn-hydrolase superfamily protein
MKSLFMPAFLSICLGAMMIPQTASAAPVNRPVNTYSILAIDHESGQMGVAVQSHWFSVGSVVSWAEAGVGVVATQSMVEASYGPIGLLLMKNGKSAPNALKALLETDKTPHVRQIAMLDCQGNVAFHTGSDCIPKAGHCQGNGFSCQANMMENDTVPQAMANAFASSRGELADRLLAALVAAEKEGGDIRGKQSAALLIVNTKPTAEPWKNRLFDLRVDDHPDPVNELQRLVKIAKAYLHMNQGDEYLAVKDTKNALVEYSKAMEIYSDNIEIVFWPAVTMAAEGHIEESLPLFQKVFAKNPKYMELLKRLPAVHQFPDDPVLLNKILSVVKK